MKTEPLFKGFQGGHQNLDHITQLFSVLFGDIKFLQCSFLLCLERQDIAICTTLGTKKTLLDVANGKAVCSMSQIFCTNFFHKKY